MNKSKITGCLLCAILLAATAAGCHSDNPEPTEPEFTTVPVERGDVIQSVYVPGELCLADTVSIQSPVESQVMELLVSSGDAVEEGEKLACLDEEPLESAVEQARANLRSAEYSLDSARLQLMQAEHGLNNLPGNATTEETRLKQEAVYLARQAVSLAEDRVDATEDEVKEAKENLKKRTICAPCDGTVLEVKADVGDKVTEGETIITLANLSEMRMLVTVTQDNIMSTKVGMSADITLDALSGTKLKGTVAQIMPLKSLTSQTPTYEVYLDLGGTPEGLLPGMTGGAEIFIAEKHNVLRLPRRLVKLAPDGSGRVEVLQNGEPVFRKVTIGVKGNNYYEIVSGVSEGDLAVQRGRF